MDALKPPINPTRSPERLSPEDRNKLNEAIRAVERDGPVFSTITAQTFDKKFFDPGAIVLPGKRLVMSSALVRSLNQEQLTSVMGHEAYHARHSRLNAVFEKAQTVMTWVAELAVGAAVLYYGMFSSQVQGALSHLNFLDLPVLVATAYVGITAARLASTSVFAQLRKMIEVKADLNALKYVPSESVISALRIVEEQSNRTQESHGRPARFLIRIMNTYPRIEKRIKILEKHSAE
jgi:Zn-dependent protease with chaperone function